MNVKCFSGKHKCFSKHFSKHVFQNLLNRHSGKTFYKLKNVFSGKHVFQNILNKLFRKTSYKPKKIILQTYINCKKEALAGIIESVDSLNKVCKEFQDSLNSVVVTCLTHSWRSSNRDTSNE